MKIFKPKTKQKVFACAKRKSAIAKSFLSEGYGQIFINDKKIEDYFKNHILLLSDAVSSILFLKCQNKYNINIFLKGGGFSAQAGAVKLALAKLLSQVSLTYLRLLAKNSFLKSDSRIKERRKFGLKKARKASQYSKR